MKRKHPTDQPFTLWQFEVWNTIQLDIKYYDPGKSMMSTHEYGPSLGIQGFISDRRNETDIFARPKLTNLEKWIKERINVLKTKEEGAQLKLKQENTSDNLREVISKGAQLTAFKQIINYIESHSDAFEISK